MDKSLLRWTSVRPRSWLDYDVLWGRTAPYPTNRWRTEEHRTNSSETLCYYQNWHSCEGQAFIHRCCYIKHWGDQQALIKIILVYVGINETLWLNWTSYKLYRNGIARIGLQLKYTLRPRQNGRHFSDDIFKWIFLNGNVWISINISRKFVPRGPINNILTLV